MTAEATTPKRRGCVLGVLAATGILICVFVGVASIAGFLGRMNWRLNLLSHFRLQYALLLAVSALLLGSLRRWRWALVAVILAVVSSVPLAPFYLSHKDAVPSDTPRLRVMLVDVTLGAAGGRDTVKTFIESANPDIIVATGVSDAWMKSMEEVTLTYSNAACRPKSDTFGIAMFSRYPFARRGFATLGGETNAPCVYAIVETPAGPLFVAGLHALPPWGAEWTSRRDRQLADVSRLLTNSAAPALVLGNFNAAPWCPAFGDLVHASGLRDSSLGWGVQPTWPDGGFLSGLATDHCLVSSGLAVLRRATGPFVGSDHRPLVVDLALRRRSLPAEDTGGRHAGG